MRLTREQVVQYLPMLLELVDKHDRSTCYGDWYPNNVGRCTRCDLLTLAEDLKDLGPDAVILDRARVLVDIHVEGIIPD